MPQKMSLTKDSMFPELKMEVTKLLGLIYFWGSRTHVGVTVIHLGMLSATVVQWYQYLRDICSWKLLYVSHAAQWPLKSGSHG